MKKLETIYTWAVLILGLLNFYPATLTLLDNMHNHGNPEYYYLLSAVYALNGIVLIATSIVNMIRKELNPIASVIQILLFIFLFPFGTAIGLCGWGLLIKAKRKGSTTDIHFPSQSVADSKSHGIKWYMERTLILIALLIPLTFISSFISISILIFTSEQYDTYKISKADPAILLSDCRTMIANQNKYRNDLFGDQNKEISISLRECPISTNIPASILNLNPTHILIREKYIAISMHTRARIVGFAEGANEWGSHKMTNGLWYISASH